MSGLVLLALAGCRPSVPKSDLENQLNAAQTVAQTHAAPQKNVAAATIEQSFSVAFGQGSLPFLLMSAACQNDEAAKRGVMADIGKWVPDAEAYLQSFSRQNGSLECRTNSLSEDFELVKSFVRQQK